MRLPSTAHSSRPWRIHDFTRDFRLEDVWALSTPGGRDDFPRLVELIAAGDPSQSSSRAVRALFAVRWRIGELFGWDGPDTGLGSRVPTLPTACRRTCARHHPGHTSRRSPLPRCTCSRTSGRGRSPTRRCTGSCTSAGSRTATAATAARWPSCRSPTASWALPTWLRSRPSGIGSSTRRSSEGSSGPGGDAKATRHLRRVAHNATRASGGLSVCPRERRPTLVSPKWSLHDQPGDTSDDNRSPRSARPQRTQMGVHRGRISSPVSRR